ncbi:unnamed protein product [Toxocara canis]|uniref:PHB domain-containing protein n=1 Tax=Toxocara canis TaxID=6265 RepID=A0A183UYF3_TOXCA|nr:unnamed protein product [Toxocara canis]
MSSKEPRTDPQWVTPSSNQDVPPDYETIGTLFGYALVVLSWILIILTFPFSMCVCLKVIKEYERVVIFRIGRLVFGGARGPGMIFVIPCIDTYRKIDLRYGLCGQLILTVTVISFSKASVTNGFLVERLREMQMRRKRAEVDSNRVVLKTVYDTKPWE